MLIFIEAKLKEGYIILSLDEAGFGSNCLQKYSWTKKGTAVHPEFTKQTNLTLLACISCEGVQAFQFIERGNNEEWHRDFL
jgi:hypothetical protein